MEKKDALLGAQFGSPVVPGAHASAVIFNFTGVRLNVTGIILNFAGSATRIVDSDPSTFTITRAFSVGDPVAGSLTYDEGIGDTAPGPARRVYPNAPDVTLTVGSSFAESLPGFQIAVDNDTGGQSINFESSFSSVTSPIFTTYVEVAMAITLVDSTRTVFMNDVLPPTIALDNFDDTRFHVVFFDPLSANLSFIEVGLEQFSAEGVWKSEIRESLIDSRGKGVPRVPQEDLPLARWIGHRRPYPEVVERATRRRFTRQYKLKILREAERCSTPGEVGALLRREGLYSSNLSAWREQREAGTLASMSATKRGQRAKLSAQDKELERLRRKLTQAEKIIGVQKKLSEVRGVSLDTPPGGRRK